MDEPRAVVIISMLGRSEKSLIRARNVPFREEFKKGVAVDIGPITFYFEDKEQASRILSNARDAAIDAS